MSTSLIITADKSPTLLNEQTGEYYHSMHGAYTESMVVFINNGLKPLLTSLPAINIFEMGLGTGLNALLTYDHTGEIPVYYEALEAFPVKEEIIKILTYKTLAVNKACDSFFEKLHSSPWEVEVDLSPAFTLCKHRADLLNFQVRPHYFDLIYFDAFSMVVQPELWTEDVFHRMFLALRPGGVLVTYSARGAVKTALRKVGFVVERLPGPPGKRHVLRAKKS